MYYVEDGEENNDDQGHETPDSLGIKLFPAIQGLC